jgi:carbon monoxide dehydrogenase subunit G
MELNNDFRVSLPPPEAWKVLTDVERIAPLMPGAQLQEIDGDEYRGLVKVKVGPITAQYKGTATFEERDEAKGHLVLKASGRDTRGQGNASASVAVDLAPDGGGTHVSVLTDLTITGKVAQFGRGVLAEVSGKLINQFVEALEADLESGGTSASSPAAGQAATGTGGAGGAGSDGAGSNPAAAPASPPAAASGAPAGAAAASAGEAAAAGSAAAPASTGPRRIDSPEPEPVDLLDAAGGSVLKRLAPVVGVLGFVLVLLGLRRRSRRRAAARQ